MSGWGWAAHPRLIISLGDAEGGSARVQGRRQVHRAEPRPGLSQGSRESAVSLAGVTGGPEPASARGGWLSGEARPGTRPFSPAPLLVPRPRTGQRCRDCLCREARSRAQGNRNTFKHAPRAPHGHAGRGGSGVEGRVSGPSRRVAPQTSPARAAVRRPLGGDGAPPDSTSWHGRDESSTVWISVCV